MLILITVVVDSHDKAILGGLLSMTARFVSINSMDNVSVDVKSIWITKVATKFRVQILINSNYLMIKEKRDIWIYISLCK